jgi:hypothetical protein
MQLPLLLTIALWLTCAMWLVGLLAYRFGLPSEFVVSIFIIGSVSAIIEWLTIKLKS